MRETNMRYHSGLDGRAYPVRPGNSSKSYVINSFLWLIAVAVFLIFTSGCDVIRLLPAEKPAPEVASQDQSILEEAYRRYEIGDFEKSAALFEQLHNDAEDTGIRQRALYGLACSRLVLAEDGEALDAAIRVWNTWSLTYPEYLADHDPRMLAPLVQRIAANGFVEPQIAYTRSEKPLEISDDFPLETVDFTARAVSEEDTETCETKLADSEKQIQDMEKKLNRMRWRIRTLKKQIESLESIHRTIQEKKKEFYYP